MGTVRQTLSLKSVDTQTTAIPQLYAVQGTNFPVIGARAFDGSSVERIFMKFSPFNYGSGDFTITIHWYAASATSGGVTWECALAAMTPNTDSGSVEAKAFATVATATDTHLGTQAKRPMSVDVTVSGAALDSIAAGDLAWLRVSRLPTDGGDTMTGDAVLIGVDVSYSDT